MLVREPQIAHLFPAEILRLSHLAERRTRSEAGPGSHAGIGVSYMRRVLFPLEGAEESRAVFHQSLRRELYLTFFKSYTEKVWGVPCTEIERRMGSAAHQGALHLEDDAAFREKTPSESPRELRRGNGNVADRTIPLSQSYGPGQMWEEVARKVQRDGRHRSSRNNVQRRSQRGENRRDVAVVEPTLRANHALRGRLFFLDHAGAGSWCAQWMTAVPENVREVSDGLMYRDFITVGLLLDELENQRQTSRARN